MNDVSAPPSDAAERPMVILDTAEDEVVQMPRRPREEAEMDITPMIDITFLLLIFFLVASKLDEGSPVDLPPARYGEVVVMKEAIVLTIAPSTGDLAHVYKGDGMTPETLIAATTPLEQEEEVARFIEDTVARDSSKTCVVIKAARKLKHGEVSRVAKAAGLAADTRLYVAVMEQQ